MENQEPLVDFSYVIELAGDKEDFVEQLLTIFLENTPPGLRELEKLVKETDDFEAISKQAHFLKSSVGIVKVRGMHERLQQIELLGKQKADKEKIVMLLEEIVSTFAEAEPLIRKKQAGEA